jgi:O-antigen ligase
MYTKYLKKINLIYILNFLIALYPFSFALGNAAINTNTLLIILIGFAYFKIDLFKIKFDIFNILVLSFFLLLIISSSINYFPILDENAVYKKHFLRSFSYLRYFFLFLVISKMMKYNILNLKYLFISAAFMSSLLALDIFLQYFTGKDIFGIVPTANMNVEGVPTKHSGFFRDEWIAGGYLRMFSPFFIFIFLIFDNRFKSKYFYFILVPILFFLFLYCTALTGNRMPTILFAMCATVFFLIEKKLRATLPILIISVSILFAYSMKTNIAFEYNFKSFAGHSKQIFLKSKEVFNQKQKINEKGEFILATDSKQEVASSHLKIFKGAITTWGENKIIGGGYRSFNINCLWGLNMWCSTHPHNYYFELLVDIGLTGALIFFLMLIIPIFQFINFYKLSASSINRFIYFPIFLILLVEFFPLKSSGSLFGTNNSTLLFFSLAIIYNLKKNITKS